MTAMSKGEKVRVKIKVYGIVQGVGFRYFILRHARYLGLNGYVKNLHDGSVEIVAEGDRPNVERLIELARQGPSSAHVERIEVYYSDYKGEFQGFYIIY